MQKPLEKNEFLLQFERLLKKYGYDTVYCRGAFDGTKKKGLDFTIVAPRNVEVNKEFNMLLDPTWGVDDVEVEDITALVICPIREDAIPRMGVPIYRGGEFYAVEGDNNEGEV